MTTIKLQRFLSVAHVTCIDSIKWINRKKRWMVRACIKLKNSHGSCTQTQLSVKLCAWISFVRPFVRYVFKLIWMSSSPRPIVTFIPMVKYLYSIQNVQSIFTRSLHCRHRLSFVVVNSIIRKSLDLALAPFDVSTPVYKVILLKIY